ncbi:MAG: hypothetical protein ABSB76_39550 [Streptosporangiaceae bacterium]|jgi:hypothetical protein
MARVIPALLAGTVACLLAGCSSSGSSGSQPSGVATSATSSPSGSASAASGFAGRYVDGPALLVQCGLSHGTIKPPTGQPWYSDGKVLPLSGSGSGSHDATFSSWWDANNQITIGGMTLSGWREWAATNDKLPAAVCGSSVSASALQAQLYPGLPNPWQG